MFFLLVLAFSGADWHIRETGVFQPLDRSEVIVGAQNQVYILNFKEAQILHFDENGEPVGQIGRKGRGPGEFTYPAQFFYDNHKIYVYDLLDSNISIFNEDGSFVEKFSVGSRELSLAKVKGGWVYGNFGTFAQNAEGHVYFVDEKFENERKLLTLPDTGNFGGMMINSDGNESRGVFSPISNRPALVLSPKGDKVYINETQLFKIWVIDTQTTDVSAIKHDYKLLPFDTEWADEQLADRKARLRGSERNARIEKAYPEYFPAIRKLMVLPSGTIIVDRWRGRPDKKHYPIALNPDGKEVDMPFSWDVASRLVNVRDGKAFLLTFDSEMEEAGLVKIDAADLVTYAEANPIVFEGSSGRSISISE